jgi:multidrug resistance protein, MATE family
MEITNGIILSRINPYFLAVSSLSGAFKGVITIFAVGVLNFSIVLFAKNEKCNNHKAIIASFYFIIVFCLLIALPSYIFFDLLNILKIDVDLVNKTKIFFGIRLIGLPLFLIFVLFKYYISSIHKTKIIWLMSIISIVTNLMGGLICMEFIKTPILQLYGIAFSSTITEFIMGLSVLIFCLVKERDLLSSLRVHLLHKDIKSYFIRLMVFGIPIGFTFVYEVGFFSIMTVLMGKVGINELAAYQVTLQLITFAFMFTLGTSEAIIILVTKAIKGSNIKETIQLTKLGLFTGSIFSTIFFVLFYFFPTFILGLYFDENNLSHSLPLNFAITYLCYAAFIQIMDTLQVILNSVLKGLNDTLVPMIYYFISYFILGLISAYIICFGMEYGASGLWLGISIGVISILLLLATRVIWKLKKINKLGIYQSIDNIYKNMA